MPHDRDTSADVSELSQVETSQTVKPPLTPKLHTSRAKEYLGSQAIGISMAIGSVAAVRHILPKQMNGLAALIQKYGAPCLKTESPAFMATQSQRLADYTVMFSAGLASTVTSQIMMARKRRSNHDLEEDIPVARDFQRVMTGWGIGFFGALASVALADRYLRKGSAHSISTFLSDAETMLDERLLGGLEFAKGRKLSEALVANASMIVGAAPASVIGQRLYDEMVQHPAYERQ